MIEEQPIVTVTPETLLAQVKTLSDQGNRLVQIGATTLKEYVEINYCFDKGGHYLTLRMQLAHDKLRVPSISGIYWCAFIYENEMHDLFGVVVDNMAVDFKGGFYKMAVKFPFVNPPAAPAAPAAAVSAAPVTAAQPVQS